MLRWIHPGDLWMGSPETEAERRDNETRHHITLTRGYWLADTACTQALWVAVLGNNPSHFTDHQDNPVERVRWNDVNGKFLSELNHLLPGLDASLPSEVQWEYACRAGTNKPFWFGDQITTKQVNYNGNYPYAIGEKGEHRQRTVAVKNLPANGWGLYEMHGNVQEWCKEWLGISDWGHCVLRGGGWRAEGKECRSANRNIVDPDCISDDIGFRLARGAY